MKGRKGISNSSSQSVIKAAHQDINETGLGKVLGEEMAKHLFLV